MTVYALAAELETLLKGRTVESASRFAGGMTIAFSGEGRRYIHLVSPGRESELLIGGAPLMCDEACRPAFGALAGAEAVSVEPLGLERVIVFRFEQKGSWGDGGELALRIDLSPVFRAAALFRTGTARPLETFGARGSRPPGSADQLPPPRRWSLDSLPEGWKPGTSGEDIGEGGDHPGTSSEKEGQAGILTRTVGGVDPALAGALAARFASDPDGLGSALSSIGRDLVSGELRWRVYDLPGSGKSGICACYPVAIPFEPRPDSPEGAFEVLDVRAGEKVLPAYTAWLRREASRRLKRELKKAERLLANVSDDLDKARRAGETRHMGNLLVTWRHRLRKGMDSVTVTDFNGEDRVDIPLDPALGPEKNIQAYFRRARKGEKGLAVIAARQGHIRKDIAELRRKVAGIESADDPAALASMIVPPKGDSGSKRPDERAGPAPRFRSYRVDGTHTILVGRSDSENDELTHRHAARTDLWFHAQGIPGSHVILRGANRSTPAKVIERAAEAAAWFSKARGSGTVPVICAEKRYVRRPRGAKPGTAVCERSRTLFVTPREPVSQ